ncbi:MAG TPA: carboxypeptidase regulatory-like domain-containing protein [Bdellovibrionota bacterium]|nr:carboxypeptidase regulatory-like domain-containing protein [Bdellovibrionota bacterium]
MRFWHIAAPVVALLVSMNSFAAATVSGKVNFKGTPPAAKPIKMNADPNCMKLHAKAVMTDYVIVNKNGTLKNAFVYVKDGLTGKSFTASTTAVTFDQRGCQYAPHVFGMMVNQPLNILNSDPTLHNVHAMPKASKQFNAGMPVKDMKITRKFEKPEIMVPIKCDVHPWMKAYVGVLDHPYYSVTNDEGAFEIKDLPVGKYTVTAWHEKYGTKDMSITVEVGKPATIDFTFESTGAEAAKAE